MRDLSNISVNEFKSALRALGLKCLRTRGGHEMWAKPGMPRPVVIQTHVSPIPEFIIRNCLRTLELSRGEFLSFLERNNL